MQRAMQWIMIGAAFTVLGAVSNAEAGTLYGLGFRLGDQMLTKMDMDTGRVTIIGNLEPYYGIEGLAFAADGTLYGIGDDLVSIDPETAACTYIDSFLTTSVRRDSYHVHGLCTTPDGLLHGLKCWNFDDIPVEPSSRLPNMVNIDPSLPASEWSVRNISGRDSVDSTGWWEGNAELVGGDLAYDPSTEKYYAIRAGSGEIVSIDCNEHKIETVMDPEGTTLGLEVVGDGRLVVAGSHDGSFGMHTIDVATGDVISSVTPVYGNPPYTQPYLFGRALAYRADDAASVPEPSTLAIFVVAGAAAGGAGLRRGRSKNRG